MFPEKRFVIDLLKEAIAQRVITLEEATAYCSVGDKLRIDVYTPLAENEERIQFICKYLLDGVSYQYDEKREKWMKYKNGEWKKV